jgi:hypothetical protein
MVSFQVTFDLPWQKDRRQTPMIQAKQRELERLDAEQEDVAGGICRSLTTAPPNCKP